jgi:hypothetical protein
MDQENLQAGTDDQRLDALLGVYRDAFPDLEPSPNFMPLLWQNIEARERKSTVFGRLARNVMTAALTLSTLLAIAASISSSRTAPLPSESYVEVLAEDHARKNLDYFEPVHISTVSDQR